MKKIPNPIKSKPIVPPFSLDTNPPELLDRFVPSSILENINQASFEVPEYVKDIIYIINHSVKLNARFPYIVKDELIYFLELLPPYNIFVESNYVNILTNDRQFLLKSGGALWIILPIGYKFTVNILVKSDKEGSVFSVLASYKDSSYEYFYEATGGNQSLNLNIDTSLGTFVGLTVSNRRKNRNSSDSIKWEFFQCNVLKLQ